jgi:PDZ domain-containing secreted protein
MGTRTDDRHLFDAAIANLAVAPARADTPHGVAGASRAPVRGLTVFVLTLAVALLSLIAELSGPYYRIEAGRTVDTRTLVHSAIAEDGSHLLLTSVARHTLTPLEVLAAWVTRDARVTRTPVDAGSGGTTADMESSISNAQAAARSFVDCPPPTALMGLQVPPVRGSSGGLMLALAILETQGLEFGGGRTIAGTGTIAPDGSVGPVGGVSFKVRAAERDGAQVFLVPASQIDEAEHAALTVRIVGVQTLAQAVFALRGRGHPKLPTCG